MDWDTIYNDYDCFKRLISCSPLPFKDWLFHDKEMRTKLLIDVFKLWKVIKPLVEKEFGPLDDPQTFYIYKEKCVINPNE